MPNPLTKEKIDRFCRLVDSLVIGADSVEDMYRKLNVLDTNGNGGWQLLRSPSWVKGTLVAVLVRPDRLFDDETDRTWDL